jgi:regulator of RNase E activity RraA
MDQVVKTPLTATPIETKVGPAVSGQILFADTGHHNQQACEGDELKSRMRQSRTSGSVGSGVR